MHMLCKTHHLQMHYNITMNEFAPTQVWIVKYNHLAAVSLEEQCDFALLQLVRWGTSPGLYNWTDIQGTFYRNNQDVSSSPTDESKWKSMAVIPYIRGRGVSESLRRILTPLDVRVCFRPATIIKQLLSHPNDPTPDLQRSEVVYTIPCTNCPASHIGQIR
jgi:hypothetical protein